jgi:DNA polymerase-3 subunit epsilon
MIRDIVMDTETTGLDARNGDRLIEIGCIEMVNRIPTGHEFHCYINPQGREVHPDAERVHGITKAFLADKPAFEAVVDDFLAFIGADGQLVIHNASFDMGFINMELGRIGRQPIPPDRVVDTLALARRKHPAGPNTLDALCKRYGIDNSKRVKHGALMDSSLLADVYVELLGERQAVLGLATPSDVAARPQLVRTVHARRRPTPLPPRLSPEDEAAHAAFVETLGERALWRRYLSSGGPAVCAPETAN